MPALFDAYLIVDWSANKTPKTGKDSIWWCLMVWDGDSLILSELHNPATRIAAFRQLKSVLLTYKLSGQRLLVGFDFAYAYPTGFAQALIGGETPAWIAVWRYLHAHIQDNQTNANNRFEVAANINQQLTGVAAPFWGCPGGQEQAFLSMRQPTGSHANLFPEFRLAEQDNGTHSVWKLSYPGAVGSQVLMGIPYVYALRTAPELAGVSRVWPFEIGLKPLGETDLHQHRIIQAEIYPSLLDVSPTEGEIKDRLQVLALAEHFAVLDQQQRLGEMFAGGRILTEQQRKIVEGEEGWILGI